MADLLEINNWSIHTVTVESVRRPMFSGYIDGDFTLFMPKCYDPTRKALISRNGNAIVLGTVSEKYSKAFPNAKDLLLQTLDKKYATQK